MGRERALGLEPQTDLGAIKSALSETREGRQAMAVAGSPPWESVPDVRELLERSRVPGSVAEGAEIAALLPLLDAASRLAAYGRSSVAEAPDLSRALAGLPRLKPLADLLRRSLDLDGTVRDEASPALRKLRQKGRELRRDLVKRLEAVLPWPRGGPDLPGALRHGETRPLRPAHPRGVQIALQGHRARSLPERGHPLRRARGRVEDNNDLVQAAPRGRGRGAARAPGPYRRGEARRCPSSRPSWTTWAGLTWPSREPNWPTRWKRPSLF